jgi:hypothetical protein
VVTHRHTRVGIRTARCAVRHHVTLAGREADLTCEPKDLCFVQLLRAERASARERLPSYREPASDKPAGRTQEIFMGILNARTVSPSVHPRPASGGAADFFLASALPSPSDLAICRCERRAMRPTDVCHPNDCVYPRLVCSRFALAACAAGTPHGVLGSVRHDQGTGRFTTSAVRFGGSTYSTYPHDGCLTAFVMSVGVFFPRC